jgi:hypothetical protein
MKPKELTGPQISILSRGYPEFQLRNVLDALNNSAQRVPVTLDASHWEWQLIDVTEKQQELMRLIAEWDKCGRNLLKFFKRNPDLQERCSEGKTYLIPTRDGVAQLAWLPVRKGQRISSQKQAALTLFTEFLVNPLSSKLAGPCKRCRGFYAKSDPRNKTYCGRECASGSTASSRTKKRRQDDHRDLLDKAELALEKLTQKGSLPKNWKKLIASEVRVGLTQKWVTRALNVGELKWPPGY